MTLVLVMATALIGNAPSGPDGPVRLVVLTDIGSLTAGVGEPDDGQSMIRLMLYANEFEIEGLIASSNMQHGRRVRPDLIERVVEAYDKVRPNLLKHDPRYPPAARLREAIAAGQPDAGPKTPVENSVGDAGDTPASEHIIRVVDRDDPRPVWILVWGGSADLAQALHKVRRTRDPARLATFVSRIRLNAIGDQDSTGAWIKREFPDLFVVTQQRSYRGMYRGGDTRLVSSDWVRSHVHGHGALGDLYPDYRGGDIFPKLGPVRGIKEGDTPSFLGLIPNGLGDPERLELPSWGGRFRPQSPNRRIDVADGYPAAPGDPDPRMVSVYRHRPAFQNDFQARLDWCVEPFENANHPPVVRVRDGLRRRVKAGTTVTLDASESSDPDRDRLTFDWSVEPGERTGPPIKAESSRASLEVPTPGTYSLVLTVTDQGRPALSRYARIEIVAE